MCNNNGHCRKFDAGTMCPSYRVTRDEKHLTRGRANTLRLALSGQLGPGRPGQRGGARGAGPVRELQGLQARLPHRRGHGEDEDRVPARTTGRSTATRSRTSWSRGCPTTRRCASRFAWLLNLRNRSPLLARAGREAAGLFGAAQPARVAVAALLQRRAAHGATREEVLAAARPVVLFVDTFNGFFESANARAALAGAAGRRLHGARRRQGTAGRQAPVLRPHLPRQRHGGRGQGQGARSAGRAAALRGARHRHRRPGALLPADAARRDAGHGPGRRRRRRWPRRPCCSRNSWRAKPRPAGWTRLRRQAAAAGQAGAGARPLPPEGLRRGGADRWRCSS